jgi:hypothetical protein
MPSFVSITAGRSFRRQGRDHAVFKNDIDIIGRGERDQRFGAVDFLVGSGTVRQLSALLAPGRGNIGEQPGQQIGPRQVGDIEPVRIARVGQPDRRQAIARSIELVEARMNSMLRENILSLRTWRPIR